MVGLYITIIALTIGAPLIINFCFLGYFNGIGKTTSVLIEGLVSSFCVRIPLSYYLSRMPGADLFTIGLAVPASAAVSLIMCIIYYFCIRKKRLAAGKV